MSKPLAVDERAELELLRDLRARVIGFGGDDYALMPWIDAHRLHAAEPYIGCPFCRDRFVLADAAALSSTGPRPNDPETTPDAAGLRAKEQRG